MKQILLSINIWTQTVTSTHTVETKDKFIAIGKCQSQDDKCHLAK